VETIFGKKGYVTMTKKKTKNETRNITWENKTKKKKKNNVQM
jgi:hypothetical protein